ncbi:MAG: OmpA family protein [Saprospiraceae bacterium]
MRLLLGILIFGLWASFARHWYVCEIKNHCEPQEIVVEPTAPERLQNLNLSFGDENILEGYNQFSFQNGISQPTIDSSNLAFLDGIVSYMIDHEEKKLKITGRFLESESDIQVNFDDNLGIARAKAIEKMLIDLGIPGDRISLDYAMVQGDELTEPIVFEILETSDTELADVQFTFNNMTFLESNFESDSDEFNPGDAFLSYADSMKTFFELNPDKTLRIIGHADETGGDLYNKDLGYRRADSAKGYIANQVGIQTEIKIESKGEKEPMATNETPEGRAKNRRINLIIE